MSFLNAIMLAGIAAVSVPIIIHLLNRRKFKTITWAAMKFVKLSVDQNQRRMRIEDLILLLIRCALVALLALALARPASKDTVSDALGQTKVTAFLILDNSYSMDLQGRNGKNTFEEARSAAQETLKALPSGSAVGVLLASDIVQGVIDEPTYDLNQAEQAIKDAKVGHHATDLYPAVEYAVKALKPLQTAQPKEVYVITDGQASGWRQNSEIQQLIADNQGSINFYVLRVGEDDFQANLAVSKMDISSGLTPINHPLRFEVEIANHGVNERQDVTVDLFVNDEESPRDQVIEADGFFVIATTLLNLGDQCRHRGAQVHEQIGRRDKFFHQLKQREVVLKVSGRHQPHGLQVGREDVGVLVDGSVLDDGLALLLHLNQLREAASKEVHLQVERPTGHVLVEIVEVGVVVHFFKVGSVAVVLGQQRGQRGFS